MINLSELTTEKRNAKTINLDSMTPLQIATAMNEEDFNAVKAVNAVLDKVAEAITIASESLSKGGRIIYMGAGTSGRLGVLDAVECPPTFGVDPSMVVGLIAGGEKAFVKAQEGIEDSKLAAQEDLITINANNNDVVIGIAASGRTPYVIGGLEYANSIDIPTIAISCNKNSKIGNIADLAIELETGPEALTGSTRLKAGTAQKLVLNMISTGSMVGIGKVYQNLMVDVQQTNEKLHVRAQNIVIDACDCDRETAVAALDRCNGHVKTAITTILLNCTPEEAKVALDNSQGHIRQALQNHQINQ